MSVDLVQLGEDIGEAKATAEAALETAEIAVVEGVVALSEDEQEGEHGCGEDCPCRTESRELRAMLVALSDKYDEDMDVVSRVLDELLGEEEDQGEEPGEDGEEESPVELIEAEESSGGSGEPTGDKPGTEGHASAGSGDNRSEAEESAKTEHKPARRTSSAGRISFRRGRR